MDGKNYITMQRLGSLGRFGNCIFQSAFLACYARQRGLTVQAPMFPGQEIFSFRFEPVTVKLPEAGERYQTPGDQQTPSILPCGDEFVNCDWMGYAQFHTTWYAPFRKQFQKMFEPVRSKAMEHVRPNHEHRVGIHLRMGDYGRKRGIFWRAPIEWYLDWLHCFWPTFSGKKKLFVAAEDPAAVQRFCRYDPVTSRDVGMAGTFTDDWMMLKQCDIILMPNSTFSFTAAMANPHLKQAWRASLPAGRFVPIDPWRATPLQFERAENYRRRLGRIAQWTWFLGLGRTRFPVDHAETRGNVMRPHRPRVGRTVPGS